MSKPFVPTWCNSPEHSWRLSRRDFLDVGMLGSVGLTLGNLFKLQAAPTATAAGHKAGAQSVIHIYLPGGMAAQESFDPKMLAPVEYRGPLSPLKTKLPGVYFTELMKETAREADKLC